MRFHMVDRIEELCYGKYIIGIKCVSMTEDIFNEHFPGHPVFPGSLVIESMAQLGGAFFELMMKHDGVKIKRAILSMVQQIKFRKPVYPGDRLVIRAEIVSKREEFGVVKVCANSGCEICAEGELIFSFVDIEDDALQKSRLELYKICMRDTKIIDSTVKP
jgi:3-hydroxyacyl-[acyl-carrier-protein] dehydratase